VDQDCDGADLATHTITHADGSVTDVADALAAGTATAPLTLHVTDATLRVCGGDWYAGAFLGGTSRVEARGGATFRSPTQPALSLIDGADAEVVGLRVEDSYRGVSSSALTGSLVLDGVELVGNEAGIVWSGTAALTLTDTRVAESVGYGVWMGGGTLDMVGGEIVDTGGLETGGLAIANGTATLTDTVFARNGSGYYAGGISAGYATVTLDGVTVEGNTGGEGGGLYAYGSVVTVRGSTFSGNAASAGGGLFVEAYSTLDVEDSALTGNTASGDGGAMVVLSTTSTVARTELSGNVAGNAGTVISVGSTEAYADADFLDNRATYAPGLYGETGTVSFTGGSFAGNVSGATGTGMGFTTVFCGQNTSFDGVSVGAGADANTPAGVYDASGDYFELTTLTTDCPNGECDIGTTQSCGGGGVVHSG
jgi:hypothetical protein